MSKVYIINKAEVAYNDEYYYVNEDRNTPVEAYKSEENAWRVALEKTLGGSPYEPAIARRIVSALASLESISDDCPEEVYIVQAVSIARPTDIIYHVQIIGDRACDGGTFTTRDKAEIAAKNVLIDRVAAIRYATTFTLPHHEWHDPEENVRIDRNGIDVLKENGIDLIAMDSSRNHDRYIPVPRIEISRELATSLVENGHITDHNVQIHELAVAEEDR